MNVVISGIFGLRNRGVEALAVPVIEQLRQRIPDLPISILTRTPDYDGNRLQQYHLELVERTISYASLRRRDRLLSKLPFYTPPTSKGSPAVEILKRASVVLASGGDVFSSDYGSLTTHLDPLKIAIENNIPAVFLAHSIGPFKRDEEVQTFLEVARRASLITVREKISYDYLTKKLGLSPDLVKQTADVAFLLQASSPTVTDKMLDSYCIKRDQPLIGLSISQGICTFSGCDYDKHLKSWYQVVKLLLDEFNAQVLIIPHVQETYIANDDRIAATNLLRILDFDPRVKIAGADHSASEFKGLISACNMVIAERMHAAIAGLSSGVCTVAVGYSIKAEGIMTDLLGAESLQKGLLISIHDFLDSAQACETIRTAWTGRDEVACKLKENIPRVKQASMSNFEMIVNLLTCEH